MAELATNREAAASDYLAAFNEITLEEEARSLLAESRRTDRLSEIQAADKQAALKRLESRPPNRRADRQVKITVRCSPEQRDQIKAIAAARGTDVNSFLLEAASEWLEKTT